jgi:Flp pilus assembly pilin Flp
MARNPIIKLWKNNDGQTAVEYIFLLGVMATIITSVLGNIKTRYLGDATKCSKPQYSRTLLCIINNNIDYLNNPAEGAKRFQFYRFKK